MDMMRSNQLVRMWEVSLHHVAVSIYTLFNLVTKICYNGQTVTLLLGAMCTFSLSI